jgi:arginine-tRNA-protein transferase
MLDADLVFINEEFDAQRVTPGQLDTLLNNGWRHFGTHFFRYNLGFYHFDIRRVIPLRIRLSDFSFSKSQRRLFRRNEDLETVIRPAIVTDEKKILFDVHRMRFSEAVPESIYDFVSADPATTPCESYEICVYSQGALLAASFFDVGQSSVSSIYAMFDPAAAVRGLGIFTLLKEIEFAINNSKVFFHLGYTYEGESFYDYKKRFRALERFDWSGGWEPFENFGPH